MADVQTLKDKIFTALENEGSEEVLAQVNALLQRQYPMVSDEIETRLSTAITNIEAGHFLTEAEFQAHCIEQDKKRMEKYG
jgi:hypothetical protein